MITYVLFLLLAISLATLVSLQTFVPGLVVNKQLAHFLLGGLDCRISFVSYDFWIGTYFDTEKKVLYFCPLPMLVFRVMM
jgi:hypothetical protein